MTLKEKVLKDAKIMGKEDFFKKYNLENTGLKDVPTEERWQFFESCTCPSFCGLEIEVSCDEQCEKCWDREYNGTDADNSEEIIMSRIRSTLVNAVGESFADDILKSRTGESSETLHEAIWESSETFHEAVYMMLLERDSYRECDIQEAIGAEFKTRLGLYEK